MSDYQNEKNTDFQRNVHHYGAENLKTAHDIILHAAGAHTKRGCFGILSNTGKRSKMVLLRMFPEDKRTLVNDCLKHLASNLNNKGLEQLMVRQLVKLHATTTEFQASQAPQATS